jgi:choline dehydrogenase-like flavoprotein
VQARCVGGTTVINSAIVVRTPGDIFVQWEREHGVGGDAMAETIGRLQDRLDDELSVVPVPADSRGRSNELAMLADARLGFDGHVIRRNARDCLGTGQCLQGCRGGRKQSTNLNYVPETLERGGHLLSCAPVDRVLMEGRRAVGVTGRFVHPTTHRRGGRFTVRARRGVLVAASVTHSPLILHRSGVRLPALGDGFRAHPGTGIFGVYDDVVDLNIGATQGWASIKFRASPGLKLETLSIPPELVAGRLAGAGDLLSQRLEEYRHLAMWVMAVRAESVGSVRPGLFGKPNVRYSLDRADMDRMRRGAHFVAQMHVAAGARSVIPGIYGMPYRLAPDEIDTLLDAPLDPRCWVAICSHIFGGCTMGADPKRSVCDGRGQVHDYEGLYIADASAIPTNLGVNPQHTIMALSMAMAESLLAA